MSSGRGGNVTVERVGFVRLAPGTITNGVLQDPAALTDALKALWKSSKFTTKRVAFGMSNGDVIVRQLDLPWMPPDDFKSALPYQVGDALPVDVSTVNLDYHPLGEFTAVDDNGKTDTMLRILLVAGNSDMVDGFSDAVLDAGLYPVRADVIPFALIRANKPESRQGAPIEAIVDMGAEITNVIVHQGGQPRFVRTIANYGGNQITRAIQERFNLTWDKAEEIKFQVGLGTHPPTAPTGTAATVFGGATPTGNQAAAPQTHPAAHLISPWASALISEIRNSLDYFLDQYQVTLSRVVLTGGGSRLNGIVARLQSELRTNVVVLDPFAQVNNKAKGIREAKQPGLNDDQVVLPAPDMSVAVGLAIGA